MRATALLAAFVLAAGLNVAAAQEPPSQPKETPHQIIDALAQRIYAIGETTGSFADAVAAEKVATEQIQAYEAGPATDGLVEVNSGGQTPLMAAAYDGFPQVVTALLASEVVQQHINDHDALGGSAWIYAELALRESIAACNPAVLKNVFAFEPLMVNQFYYVGAPENPYRAVRRELLSKGVRGDSEEAKRFWVDHCKNEDAHTRETIERSSDVLSATITIGTQQLAQFMIRMQQGMRQRQSAPPQ